MKTILNIYSTSDGSSLDLDLSGYTATTLHDALYGPYPFATCDIELTLSDGFADWFRDLGSMDLSSICARASALRRVDDRVGEAFQAYVDHYDLDDPLDDDLDSIVSQFYDSYQGHWDHWEDFVETQIVAEYPNATWIINQSVDRCEFSRLIADDYWISKEFDGSIYVFKNQEK